LTSTSSRESTEPGLGDELGDEVRLAVGEAAGHGRADAGAIIGSTASRSRLTCTNAAPDRKASASLIARSRPALSTSLIV
jgi:hypothetical protein